MDLNLLKIFEIVSESGSLTKASRTLGHPKSKLSRDLTKLENELEVTLLYRTPRGIQLTELGKELYHQIKYPLEELRSKTLLIKSHTQEMRGVIRLTASDDLSQFILPTLIFDFMQLHPEIHIELLSTNSFLDFKKFQIDLALRIGKLSNSDLKQKKISQVNLILVASPLYINSHKEIQSPIDLGENHNLGLMTDPFGNLLSKDFSKKLPYRFICSSIPVLKAYAINGLGISTLPKLMNGYTPAI